MKGFPKHLNSKNDYLNIKKDFPEEIWKPAFQELLDTKDSWLMESKLASLKETGITDAKRKVIDVRDEQDAVIEKYQYVYKEDPNCRLFRLGFNVKEVEMILTG